mmetsp:Transcript_22700/g.57834  ORF Transcript_22700/g.57834 Transcript_22700/m.57834 type:complete len:93 (+) Transcript_22700:125-403(+)
MCMTDAKRSLAFHLVLLYKYLTGCTKRQLVADGGPDAQTSVSQEPFPYCPRSKGRDGGEFPTNLEALASSALAPRPWFLGSSQALLVHRCDR